MENNISLVLTEGELNVILHALLHKTADSGNSAKAQKQYEDLYEKLTHEAERRKKLNAEQPMLINKWEELLPIESETHILEIDLRYGSGWIRPRDRSIKYEEYFMNDCYLSTHTFYESNYQRSTEILQQCGFNVQLKSWG